MQSCISTLTTERFQFKWELNYFSHLPRDPPYYQHADPFVTSCGSWRLIIYPQGMDDHISLYLQLLMTNGRHNLQEIQQIEFIIKSAHDNDYIRSAENKVMYSECGPAGYCHFISRYNLFSRGDLLPQDTLTIIVSGSIRHMSTAEELDVFGNPPTITADLKKLLDSNSNADVTLVAEGQEFPAHKIILAARSPVFSAMFAHRMTEGISGRAELKDMRTEILRALLVFMYTDDIPQEKQPLEFWKDLVLAADMYDIPRLKSLCEVKLWRNMDTSNVLNLLEFSASMRSDKLKRLCIKFCTSRYRMLEKLKWFKPALRGLPRDLLIELLEHSFGNHDETHEQWVN